MNACSHDTKFRTTLDPETIETTEAQARDFIRSISSLVRRRQEQAQQSGESSGIYIFGSKPCVADAVATALLARLIDVGRDDLFDDAAAKDYTSRVRQSDEWKAFMQDRRTVPGA